MPHTDEIKNVLPIWLDYANITIERASVNKIGGDDLANRISKAPEERKQEFIEVATRLFA